MLKNERGYYLQGWELYPLLGITHQKLPREGFEAREVQGVTFRCEPAQAPRYRGDGRRVKISKHRLRYLCRECDKWIPFGRAAQHRKGREHKEAAKEGRHEFTPQGLR